MADRTVDMNAALAAAEDLLLAAFHALLEAPGDAARLRAFEEARALFRRASLME